MKFTAKLLFLAVISITSMVTMAGPINLNMPQRNLELGLGFGQEDDGATFNNYFVDRQPSSFGLQKKGGQNPFGFAKPEEPTIDQNFHLVQGSNGQIRVIPAQMFQWKMYQGRR